MSRSLIMIISGAVALICTSFLFEKLKQKTGISPKVDKSNISKRAQLDSKEQSSETDQL